MHAKGRGEPPPLRTVDEVRPGHAAPVGPVHEQPVLGAPESPLRSAGAREMRVSDTSARREGRREVNAWGRGATMPESQSRAPCRRWPCRSS